MNELDKALIEAVCRTKPAGVTGEELAACLGKADGAHIRDCGRKAGEGAARAYFKCVLGKGEGFRAIWLCGTLDVLIKTMASMKTKGVSEAALALWHSGFVEALIASFVSCASLTKREFERPTLN